jgi:hypothetical protein
MHLPGHDLSLDSLLIPASVTEICAGAFSRFINLQTVAISSDTLIESIVGFSDCTLLWSVLFSSAPSLQRLSSFECCCALRRIKIPASVQNLCGFPTVLI